MLSTLLLILAVLIGCILLAGLILPKNSSLSVETTINRPSDTVFQYVKFLRNQEYYSKWVMADPNRKLTYTGTDGTIGFRAAWASDMKDVGAGEQEITAIQEGKRYDVEIRFERPFKGVSTAFTTTEALSANETKVTNTFNTTTPFPMNIMTPIMKKMLLKDMNMTLSNLKQVLEQPN